MYYMHYILKEKALLIQILKLIKAHFIKFAIYFLAYL